MYIHVEVYHSQTTRTFSPDRFLNLDRIVGQSCNIVAAIL